MVSQCFERIHFQFWQSTFLCWEVLTHKAIAVVMMVNTNGSITIALENHNHCHHVSLLIYCITAHLFFFFFLYIQIYTVYIYIHRSSSIWLVVSTPGGKNKTLANQNYHLSRAWGLASPWLPILI